MPLDAVEDIAIAVPRRRRGQCVDVRPGPLLGDGVALVELPSDRGQHPSLHLDVAGDAGEPRGRSGDHPGQRVGHPPGLLLDENLLEHRESAAAELARHVDRLQPELPDPLPGALQDSVRRNAIVELGGGLVGDELLDNRRRTSLDLEVLGGQAVRLLHRALKERDVD